MTTTLTLATENGPTQIVEAADRWTRKDAKLSFRVWNGRLYRREEGERFYAGYQVKYVSLANERLVKEWTR